MKLLHASLLCAACVLSLSTTQAFARDYEFRFFANSDSDSNVTSNHAFDVSYTVKFNSDKFQSFDLQSINNSRHWLDKDITLLMEFGMHSVYLNDALNPTTPYVSIKMDPISGPGSELYEGGFIELYSQKSEFLDIDFHSFSSFVLNNQLPFTPFVYGQLDVYDNQTSFSDFHKLWVNGDTSVLAKYEVSAVPEPSSVIMLSLGGLICAAAARAKCNPKRDIA